TCLRRRKQPAMVLLFVPMSQFNYNQILAFKWLSRSNLQQNKNPNRFFKWRARYACRVLPIGLLALMIIFTAERNRMSNEFFLDTAYAIALSVESDEHHQLAEELAEQLLANQTPLVTTRSRAAGNRECVIKEALSSSGRRIVGRSRT